MSKAMIVGLFAAVVLGVPIAHAQIAYDGCTDYRGMPVATVLDERLPIVAAASLTPSGEPVIRYNPRILAWLAPPTRLFFFTRECVRHAQGYTVKRMAPMFMEQQADCIAISGLMAQGQIGERELDVIQRDIARLGRNDWSHLSGAQRAVNLQRCLVENSAPFTPPDSGASCCDRNGRRWCRIDEDANPAGGECSCGGMLRNGHVCW